MIGVNQQSQVKVWLNSNFAVNSPEDQPIAMGNLESTAHEQEMVHSILGLVEVKAEDSGMWAEYSTLRQRDTPSTFEKAI